MKYCDSCHFLTNDKICPLCGNDSLREPTDKDYCFVVEKEEIWAKMFMEILKDNDIACINFPVLGSGVTVKTGAVERYKIYVPYEKYDKASNLLKLSFKD